MKNEILSLLGLAMKAGKCVSGEFTVEKTVKDHKAKLVGRAQKHTDRMDRIERTQNDRKRKDMRYSC